jgi:hypothetical protein
MNYIDPNNLLFHAVKQRPEANPTKIWMGDNWPERTPGVRIYFSGFELRFIPMAINAPNSDSCVEWDDGFVTILRDENGPAFEATPPRLGLARVGVGEKTRGNERKLAKSARNGAKSAKSTRKGGR